MHLIFDLPKCVLDYFTKYYSHQYFVLYSIYLERSVVSITLYMLYLFTTGDRAVFRPASGTGTGSGVKVQTLDRYGKPVPL